jgi:hypothetical protein
MPGPQEARARHAGSRREVRRERLTLDPGKWIESPPREQRVRAAQRRVAEHHQAVMLHVTVRGGEQVVELINVYFAKDVVHYLISYGLDDKRGFKLTQPAERRVVAAKDG